MFCSALGALRPEDPFRADCTCSFTLLVGGGGVAARTAGASACACAVVIVSDGKMTATAAISPSHNRNGSGLAGLWSDSIPLSCVRELSPATLPGRRLVRR